MELEQALKILGIYDTGDIDKNELKSIWRQCIKANHPDLTENREVNTESVKHREENIKLINLAYKTVVTGFDRINEARNDASRRDIEWSNPIWRNYNGRNKTTNKRVVLNIEQILYIYDGQTIILKDKQDNRVKLYLDNLTEYNVIVHVDYVIEIEEDKFNGTAHFVWRGERKKYNIRIDVPASSLTKHVPMKLNIVNKEVGCIWKNKSMSVIFRLQYGVELNIEIERYVLN